MNPIRKHAGGLRWRVVRCALTLWLAASSPVFAQNAPIAQRLSPKTVAYLEWHGTPSLSGAHEKNHVLQMLHDPAFASILAAAAASHAKTGDAKATNPLVAMALTDAMSLLDNSFACGIVMNPAAKQDAPDQAKASAVATFLVYDSTGKTDLIQKWKALSQLSGKEPVEVTKYDFEGTSVEVRAGRGNEKNTGAKTPSPKNFTYTAQAGHYFLVSDEKEIIEDLIGRFRSMEAPAAMVAQTPQYGEWRKYAGDGATMEMFARIPDVSEWSLAEKSAKAVNQFAQGIHLDRVHVIGGALNFDGEATRFRGAVLGDASAGGPFDIAGASGGTFQTLPLVAAGPSFSITRMNLEATYELIRNAIMGSLPPQQSAGVAGAEAMAQGYIGMSIMDALNLFTGEYASRSSYSEDGKPEQLFAVTIQKPDSVLRVTRALIGKMIAAEDTSGTTTYLDILYPSQDPKTHAPTKKPYYAAVTPHMLLVAPRKQMLRDAVAKLDTATADAPPAGVTANPEYAALRGRLPEKLSGLSASDIGAIPWDKVLANLQTQIADSTQSAKQPSSQPMDLSWIKPEVVLRYIHISVGGWWKDANGVYVDSYVQ